MSKLTGSKKATQFTESVIREMTRLNQLYGGVNLSQGFPDFPAPAAIKEAACAAINADVNQYAVTWGARPLREAIAREFTEALRPGDRRRRAGDRLLRDDRSDDVDDDGDHRSGRRGRHLRAVLRELRTRRDPVGCDAALRHAARARSVRAIGFAGGRVVDRSGRARGGVQRQDQGDHHQHAEQPDRQGVLARGARDDRHAVPQVGRDRHLRRDLRAHHLRRPPPHPDRDARGHGRPYGHAQRPLEDLQRDRLARRLDDLAAVAHRRDSQGARFPDRGRAGTAAGSGRGGARLRRGLLHARSRRTTRPAATRSSASSNGITSRPTSRPARTTS